MVFPFGTTKPLGRPDWDGCQNEYHRHDRSFSYAMASLAISFYVSMTPSFSLYLIIDYNLITLIYGMVTEALGFFNLFLMVKIKYISNTIQKKNNTKQYINEYSE